MFQLIIKSNRKSQAEPEVPTGTTPAKFLVEFQILELLQFVQQSTKKAWPSFYPITEMPFSMTKSASKLENLCYLNHLP